MPLQQSEPDKSDNLQEMAARWQQNLQGRYRSSWTWLTRASAGCILNSAEKTSKLIKYFSRVCEKNEHRGDVWGLMNLAYNEELLGPLAGSMALAAFAIESFLRLTTCVCLYDKHKGELTIVDRDLETLLDATFEERLCFVEKLIGSHSVAERDRKAVKRLIEYRNKCAHDEPRFYGNFGDMKQYDRRSRNTQSLPFQPSSIPLLGEKNRALTLRNALRAAATHDRLVRHVLRFAWPLLHKYHLCSESTTTHYILESFPKNVTMETLRAIADEWDKVDSWLESVTLREQRDLGARLRRHAFKIVEA